MVKRRAPHGELSEMTAAGLKHARARLGLTQAQLGALLGVDGKEVYKKEADIRPVTKVQALAIRGLLLAAAIRAAGGDPDKLIGTDI